MRVKCVFGLYICIQSYIIENHVKYSVFIKLFNTTLGTKPFIVFQPPNRTVILNVQILLVILFLIIYVLMIVKTLY